MPSTNQSIVVEQPVQAVWEVMKDFHDMSWSTNVIAKCEAVGDTPGNEVGAQRILNGVFHETLIEVNAADHVIRYSIDEGPVPVSSNDLSNYTGVIHLTPTENDRTLVEWSSSWDSKNEDAVEFCHTVYVGLLNDLAGSLKH